MTKENIQETEPKMEGWLHKWTNYIKGYQKRWFVLSNGQLSYYRYQADVGNQCRGFINLYDSVIHTEDTFHFIVSSSGTQTFHLRTNSEVEKQQWVTTLELAKAKAVHIMESEDEEDFEEITFPSNNDETKKIFTADLKDMNNYKDLLSDQVSALEKSLQEIEQLENINSDLRAKLLDVKDKATYIQITANAVINARTEYFELVQMQGRKLERKLQNEHEQKLQLEEELEQLAHQHSRFEEVAKKVADRRELTASIYLDADDTFYDAEAEANFIVNVPQSKNRQSRVISIQSEDSVAMNDCSSSCTKKDEEKVETSSKYQTQNKANSIISRQSSIDVQNKNLRISFSMNGSSSAVPKKRRTHILEKPNYGFNIWAIIKNCIGKELTRVSLPINFNEPLSMLQRLTEDFEYAEILDRAAFCSDTCEQLAHIAAFTVSSYATTSNRTGKPFNPLLGESYECDRMEDLGWRAVSEQVSHHPPIAAMYCEGREWIFWQEFTMSSKFRGRYLQIIPLGIAHLQFTNSGNHYTWQKVVTNVHNFIVGKLWVDHHGEMDITNHTTGDKCHLKYVPYSYFSRDKPRMVYGTVSDKSNDVKWLLSGQWDLKIEGAKVFGTKGLEKGKPVFDTSEYEILWERQFPPDEYEKTYCFTQLAVQLNEPEEGVAPTDSRNRPDQRFMENVMWDEATAEKIRLEEKQRAIRRQREEEAEKAAAEGRPYTVYEPIWFKKETDSVTGNPIHMYNGKYWECKQKQDWSMCPDIY